MAINALEALALDHEKISDLFDRLHEADQLKEKQDIFEVLREELVSHSHLEETGFYPVLREDPEFDDIVATSLTDHQRIREMLTEVDASDDEVDFDARLDELLEWVDQHVDQEENELFPKVRARLPEQKLEEMGRMFASMKGYTAHAA
jgi:hemerythrin superfamily protein